MLVRSCLYQSHLRHTCFSLKIWGISLSLRTKNVVITSWQQIHIRCLLSQRCSAHWGTYSVGKSSICCSISLFLIMLSLKTYFGVKQVFKAVQLHCVILGLIRPVSLVLLTGSCESSLRGSLVCDQLPDALGSTVPDWQSSQLGWDAMLRTGDMGQQFWKFLLRQSQMWLQTLNSMMNYCSFFPGSWCILVPFINFPLVLWQQSLYFFTIF